MGRRAPRHAGTALRQVLESTAPATPLARVQACWAQAAGNEVAGRARPVAERSGVLAVECESAIWAGELAMMEPQLRERLNRLLGEGAVSAIRFDARGSGRQPV